MEIYILKQYDSHGGIKPVIPGKVRQQEDPRQYSLSRIDKRAEDVRQNYLVQFPVSSIF